MDIQYFNELKKRRISGTDISVLISELKEKGYPEQEITATIDTIEKGILSKHYRRSVKGNSLFSNMTVTKLFQLLSVIALVISLTYFFARIVIWVIEYEKGREDSPLLTFSVLALLIALPVYLTTKNKLKHNK
jgi:hypothetical protein